MDGFMAYWTKDIWVDSCSTCSGKAQKTINLHFNNQELRFCMSCAVALRELLINMIEDDEIEEAVSDG